MDIENVYKEIIKQYELNLQKMFAQFGYDKEYLISHAEEFHTVETPNRKLYFHKNKELFYVVTSIKDDKYTCVNGI